MRLIAIPFVVSLSLLGMVGMMRGSALADVRVEGGGASVAPDLAHERSTPAVSAFGVHLSTATPIPDYLPTHEPGRVLAPGETVRVLTVEQWRATRQFPEELQYRMTRACWCESHLDPSLAIVDTNGHWSIGACMVQPVWWGEVPAGLDAQIAQVVAILDSQRDDPRGPTWPWAATIDGCREWNAK